ncbi:hypothetical protein FS837_012047 [Tulasnella sp. UAMH 9824]|nr:hypothetical protein FS837_012047 [Tulasnella sp. UAMH 9824]
MNENIKEKSETSPSTSAQAASLDDVEEAMKRLKIRPRKVLESLSHIRLDRARIEPIETQAPKAGGKADVVAAVLTSVQPSSSSEPEYVAVKKLRFDTETDGDRALAPFAHEVKLLNDLSHSNVVKIVGFIEDVNNGVAWMVFSWEKNGNLREFVRSEKWELPERVSLIDDVARGLSYLHGRNPPICHGDLKSLNILVNPKNRAFITDFGSARAIDSATEAVISSVDETKPINIPHHALTGTATMEALKIEVPAPGEFITMTGPAWTVRWAAPELLKGGLPDLSSDIWALGWICWEVVTGNFPFNEDNEVNVIRRIVTKDLPNLSNNAEFNQIKTLCSLMEECLRLAASARPTALRCQQVVSFMESVQDQAIPFHKGGNSSVTTRSSGLLHALGWIELGNGVLYKAQECFRQSLEISESVGDEKGKARAMNAMGQAYLLQNKYSEAEESYIQSRDLYSKIGYKIGIAQSVKALGDVYRMRNEYSKAEESYIQSRDLYSKIGDQLGFAQSVNALADVYRMWTQYS